MNSRLAFLVKGELIRLHKYNITSVSIIVAILWGIMLYFVNTAVFDTMLPILVMMDASMMALMFVGSVMFFEKSESTISTMLVTPVTNRELLVSKLIANVAHNIIASLLLVIVFVFVKDVQINFIILFLGILVCTSSFTLAGIILSYFSKDFMGLLMFVFVIMITLAVPFVLLMLDIISGPVWENILMFSPLQAAQEIINAGFKGYEFTYRYFVSFGLLFFGGIFGYYFYALPKFQDYAVKQSGV